MIRVFVFAILSAMPVAVDSTTADTPEQVEQNESQEVERQFLVTASVWEEINPKSGKARRRVLCEPTLVVTEGKKARFYSGGQIPANVVDRSNDLPIGTSLNAVVIEKDIDSVRIACEISVGTCLQSVDGGIRTFTQSFGIARDLKLGEEQTIPYDLGMRKIRLTIEVDGVDSMENGE